MQNIFFLGVFGTIFFCWTHKTWIKLFFWLFAATCMRALIPSTVPTCLCSLLRPTLALSPSEFKSYVQALTPTPVPEGFRQSGSRPGQTALPITGLATRAFCCPLLLTTPPRAFPRPLLLTTPPRVFPCPLVLTTPRVREYSGDNVFLPHPPHFVHHPPAPVPDNSIIIATVVSMCILLFM